jgi:methionyl-tRNA formyltransferase
MVALSGFSPNSERFAQQLTAGKLAHVTLLAQMGDPEPFIEFQWPGTLLDDAALVATGQGALRLSRLQRPGRAAMDAEAFLRGFALPRGTVLA